MYALRLILQSFVYPGCRLLRLLQRLLLLGFCVSLLLTGPLQMALV